MLSLPHLENQIRGKFSNETKNQLQPFVSRLKNWYQWTFASRTYRHFSFTYKRTVTHDSLMQSLSEIFPTYEVYIGSVSSYELCQDTFECAMTAGNKMFWFTISNEQVELEITFLITRDYRVEVALYQKSLAPITYARTTPSSAA